MRSRMYRYVARDVSGAMLVVAIVFATVSATTRKKGLRRVDGAALAAVCA